MVRSFFLIRQYNYQTLHACYPLTFAQLLGPPDDLCLVMFYFKVYWHFRKFFSAIGASAVIILDDFVGRFQIFSVIENRFAFLTDHPQRHQFHSKEQSRCQLFRVWIKHKESVFRGLPHTLNRHFSCSRVLQLCSILQKRCCRARAKHDLCSYC